MYVQIILKSIIIIISLNYRLINYLKKKLFFRMFVISLLFYIIYFVISYYYFFIIFLLYLLFCINTILLFNKIEQH